MWRIEINVMEKRVAGPIGGVVVYIIPILNQSINLFSGKSCGESLGE